MPKRLEQLQGALPAISFRHGPARVRTTRGLYSMAAMRRLRLRKKKKNVGRRARRAFLEEEGGGGGRGGTKREGMGEREQSNIPLDLMEYLMAVFRGQGSHALLGSVNFEGSAMLMVWPQIPEPPVRLRWSSAENIRIRSSLGPVGR